MTDHRTEALELLERANLATDHRVALALATMSQVHATLAHTAAMERIARGSTPVLGGRL